MADPPVIGQKDWGPVLNTYLAQEAGKVTDATGQIAALGFQVTSAETKVGVVEGQVSSLGTRTTAVEGKVQTLEQADFPAQIAAVKVNADKVPALKVETDKIPAIKANSDQVPAIKVNADKVPGLETRIGTAEGKITALEGKVSTLEDWVNKETIVSDVSTWFDAGSANWDISTSADFAYMYAYIVRGIVYIDFQALRKNTAVPANPGLSGLSTIFKVKSGAPFSFRAADLYTTVWCPACGAVPVRSRRSDGAVMLFAAPTTGIPAGSFVSGTLKLPVTVTGVLRAVPQDAPFVPDPPGSIRPPAPVTP